jgi:hypothetical protein
MDTSPKLCNVFLSSNAALLFFQPAPVFSSIILGNLFVLPNLQGNHPHCQRALPKTKGRPNLPSVKKKYGSLP